MLAEMNERRAARARLAADGVAPTVDEVITVLEDIRGFYSTANCWCDAEGDSPHFQQCERAADLYERLKLSRSAATTAAPVEQLENRKPVDVSRQHDFVQVVDLDHCGLQGCAFGVLEHSWIPPLKI